MSGSVYQTVFGGNVVAPALPTYLALSISANAILGWPLESNITAPAAAEIIDVTATVPALTIQLSDARQVSTGYCALFNNVGANTFTLLDAQGNTLMAPAPGQAWQIYLADNSTLQGTWRVFQYGASVSTANAATLAGAGLKAISTTLNEQILINAQAVNYLIGSGASQDRASCVEWTGGSGGVFSTSNAATLGSGWFCYIKNSGTGVLTLTPGSGTINGTASMTFNPNDSAIIATDGTNFFSIGFGQSVASSFNFVQISLAGASGNVTLSGAQLNRISYKFTGLLAGNTTVIVPASIQQYWVDNETTGAFTLTISAGGAGTTYTVPQATRVILYCDGLNIVNAITASGFTFGNGSAASPSITFSSDSSTGLYLPGSHVLGFAAGGIAVGSVNGSGQWAIPAATSGTVLTIGALDNTQAIILNDGSPTAGYSISFQNSTVTRGQIGLGAATLTGAAVGDFSIVANTGTLRLGTGTTTNIAISAAGNVTVSAPSSGVGITATGAANAYVESLTASGTASQSFGLQIAAGTNASDKALLVTNQAGTHTYLSINGDGSGTFGFNGSAASISVSAAGNVSVSITSGTGVSVSGPAATQLTALSLSQSGQTSWNIYQPASNSDFRINNGADRVVITTAGDVTVNAPASGVALTVNGASGNVTSLQVVSGQGATGTSGDILIQRAGSTVNLISEGPNLYLLDTSNTTGTVIQQSGGQTEFWQFNGSWVQSLRILVNKQVQVLDAGGTMQTIGWRGTPLNTQVSNYTLVLADQGKTINIGNGVTITVPNGVFGAGDVVSLMIGSGGTATIAQGVGLTLEWAGNGATTGNRTFTGAGLAVVAFQSSSVAFISGAGLT